MRYHIGMYRYGVWKVTSHTDDLDDAVKSARELYAEYDETGAGATSIYDSETETDARISYDSTVSGLIWIQAAAQQTGKSLKNPCHSCYQRESYWIVTDPRVPSNDQAKICNPCSEYFRKHEKQIAAEWRITLISISIPITSE